MQGMSNRLRWLLTLVVLFILALSLVPQVTTSGEHYIDGALKRALVGFAIARGLNGVVSVAQGTEFSIAPAGIGVNFAPGEILDPINDLIERFSWIMLLSSSALGVQKVLLSMSTWAGLTAALCVVGALYVGVLWIRQLPRGWFAEQLGRLFLLLLVLRFMMPVISLANEWVYRVFLADQYQQASIELEEARQRIGALNDEVLERPVSDDDQSLLDRAREVYKNAVSQLQFEKRLEDYQQAADKVSENTVGLIVVFVMQTVVFPLLFLWIAYLLLGRIWRGSGKN